MFNATKFTRLYFATIATLAIAITFFCLFRTPKTMATSAQERTTVMRGFPEGVIAVTKTENLQSADFPKGFQIGVKNISNKPIYYARIIVTLPETNGVVDQRPLGFSLIYGSSRLRSIGSRAETGDQAILPGKSVVLKEDDSHAQNFIDHLSKYNFSLAKSCKTVVLTSQEINFGDGTGYRASQLLGNQTSWAKSDQYILIPASTRSANERFGCIVDYTEFLINCFPECYDVSRFSILIDQRNGYNLYDYGFWCSDVYCIDQYLNYDCVST